MDIRWFRTSSGQKMIKSPQAPKVQRQPKAPKSSPPPKVKVVKPKSPLGFKKKLYIPKKFVTAGYGTPGMDYSPAAIANLMTYMYNNDKTLSYVEWVNPSPSNRCDTGICDDLNGEMRINDLSELLKGITGWSHEGCDCHIVVTFTDGETHKVTVDDDLAHLQWVSAPRSETDVTNQDEDAYIDDFSDAGPQKRWVEEQGLSVQDGDDDSFDDED